MESCNYSVVVPVFNSEKTIAELFKRIEDVFKEAAESFEIILVDDGSGDDSWEEIKKLKQNFPGIVKGVRFSKNFGQHNALLCGFRFTKGNFVITMDDDLQTPPEEIHKLMKAINGSKSDMVYGTYESKQHSGFRNSGS